ncbi:hypothetical protein ACFS7Z_13905 [Pontibacter toksunensis]|uniref:Uncharacterized protein n=1 Tax=Pontibacter toksunensis TaxID=1332631 RepID=A0ABW6BUI0_9BACT
METYKYTYEDWLKGEIHNEDLEDLVKQKYLGEDDLKRVRSDQEFAYSNHIAMHLQMMKIAFYQRYEHSFAKEELLNQQVKAAEEDLQSFKDSNPVVYWEAINGIDNRYRLTPPFIPHYLINSSFIDELEEILPTHISYYTKSNFYRWLKWLKEDGKEDTEPSFQAFSEEFRKGFERSRQRLDRFRKLDSERADKYVKELFNLPFIKERVVGLMTEQAVKTLSVITHEQPNSNENSKGELVSYIWQDDHKEELPKLYKLMKDKYLHKHTTLKQFKAAFTAKPIENLVPVK